METESVQGVISLELVAELTKMRRNPQHFTVKSMSHCRFCGGKDKNVFQLRRGQDASEAGSWCPVHGWIFFDSVGSPPTERLTASEIEDQRLRQRRQEEFTIRQQRKEAQ